MATIKGILGLYSKHCGTSQSYTEEKSRLRNVYLRYLKNSFLSSINATAINKFFKHFRGHDSRGRWETDAWHAFFYLPAPIKFQVGLTSTFRLG